MENERLKTPVHPTQKPLRILKQLIELATEPGHLILDLFMGVGSSGVASLELGRWFTGIEIDPVYFEAAAKRIAAVQCPLFAKQKRRDAINQVKAAIEAQGDAAHTRQADAGICLMQSGATERGSRNAYLGALDVFISDLAARSPGTKKTGIKSGSFALPNN